MADDRPQHEEHTHHHHEHGHHGQGWNRQQLANLERPDREEIMPKTPVLIAMNAQLGERVADVGAGLGYFSFPLAVAVGASGTVLAIDPSEDACQELRMRARQAQVDQITVIQAGAERTGVEATTIDRILWHTMYHDVHDLVQSVTEMHRILKPGGLWVVVDWIKQETGMGPPLSVRVNPSEAQAQAELLGFKLVKQFSPGPVTWGLVFERQ